MRHHFVEPVGAGSRRRVGVDLVIIAGLLQRAFGHHQDERQIVRHQRVHLLGVDRDGHVIDLLHVVDVVGARARAGKIRRAEGRALLGHQALEVPEGDVGVPGAAIVELHPRAQLQHPAFMIIGIDGPCGRESGFEPHLDAGFRHVPVEQPVVEVEADEPIAFKSLVGLPGPVRDVACGHGDPQHGLGADRKGGRGGDGQRQPGGSKQTPGRLRHRAIPPRFEIGTHFTLQGRCQSGPEIGRTC